MATSLKPLFISLLSATALFVSAHRCTKLGDGGRWVSYTAQYTETVTTRDASGATSNKQTLTEELRSEDGAVLSMVKENGQATSGRLWQADGHKYSLDYIQKRAIDDGVSPRKHPYVPPDAVPGTKTVLGVTCDIYPLHGSAMGTICGDMNDDILVRLEVHSDADRIHQDLTRQLTSIDLTTPVEPSKIAIPSGFTTLVPSTSQH